MRLEQTGSLSERKLQPDQILTQPARRFLEKFIKQKFGGWLSEAEREDIVQVAWKKAADEIATFRGESNFETWLGKLAYYSAISYLRQERSRKRGETKEGWEPEIGRLSAPMMGQEDWEAFDALEKRFAKLSPREKDLMHLRAQDLSDEEIAERLGIPLGTVKSNLFRARAILRGEREEDEKKPKRRLH